MTNPWRSKGSVALGFLIFFTKSNISRYIMSQGTRNYMEAPDPPSLLSSGVVRVHESAGQASNHIHSAGLATYRLP